MAVIKFKQGDTFLMTCQYRENGAPAPLPATIRAQVRSGSDALIKELTVTRVDEAGGQYTLSSATDAWPIGSVYIDVEYTYSNGTISRTPTIQLSMVKAITHD